MGVPTSPDYDVLVVGGGLSGIYSLYRMLKLGLKCLVLEEGSGEGGTWFWYAFHIEDCVASGDVMKAYYDLVQESVSRL